MAVYSLTLSVIWCEKGQGEFSTNYFSRLFKSLFL